MMGNIDGFMRWFLILWKKLPLMEHCCLHLWGFGWLVLMGLSFLLAYWVQPFAMKYWTTYSSNIVGRDEWEGVTIAWGCWGICKDGSIEASILIKFIDSPTASKLEKKGLCIKSSSFSFFTTTSGSIGSISMFF